MVSGTAFPRKLSNVHEVDGSAPVGSNVHEADGCMRSNVHGSKDCSGPCISFPACSGAIFPLSLGSTSAH